MRLPAPPITLVTIPYSLQMSFSRFAKVALGSVLVTLGVNAGTPLSCTNTQISCKNTTAVADSCCFNSPGGQLLLTQFWDTDPVTGPVDSWTIHGLWPDKCDGTYDANCDSSRAYTGIAGILTAAGQTSLLSYMQTYWKDYNGDDESFWEHEWSKHGTCINTLNPSCYTGYTAKEELVNFFEVTVQLFKGLDTYKTLTAAGITPSTSKTYTSAEIQAALKAATGHTVTLGCSNGALNEVWYHFNVKGSVSTGEFIATEPDGTKSTCAASGVKYLPKSGATTSPTTSPTKTSSAAVPTGTGIFSGSGYLNAIIGGAIKGCIIGAGTWYTTGTCASFTAAASGSGFTLSSSKGACAIVNGALSCASGNTATVFTASGGLLVSSGSTAFYAASVPSGSTQATVYTSSTSAHSTALTISWKSV
ncbi:uncharacterized protein LAJ45_01546 [Morchella importuna]|uniref:uncharacterized protein n=1 Tax=Morchella importuna TaxID=1174673 RepID=UPI001E8E8A1C|nr:uncharacterized protein LAJ45_01546 [Morchella importuna]KAH8153779.1 hypothetical protein LAJ45_01546 [Morchella importuna]